MPETDPEYRPALELYAAARLSCVEICRQYGISVNGYPRYVSTCRRKGLHYEEGLPVDGYSARRYNPATAAPPNTPQS